ncbi:regulatory-associated protein of TOR 1-like [Olea europaea var. sylvestris]|uniref:regulatory-associated protein of TOR 1-like n=1 Tax=Olea europaea var. sylvestris TaxID=158386 RepID=UPI000C1CF151|nr:regulatory-associated protein of TOR 1-like [Olea europaea var. sylvestris]
MSSQQNQFDLGDLMAALRFPVSSILFNHLEGLASSGNHVNGDDMRIMSSSNSLNNSSNIRDFPESASSSYAAAAITTSSSMAYLPRTLVLCELRHDGFEEMVSSGPSNSGLIAKWWPRDRMKTVCVALVLCLNNSIDLPNIIKISPFARMECWIGTQSHPIFLLVILIGR